jgi:Glu-tRNA(Gln) amidotransferase subunit E-like FAD-binding protein
LVQYSNLKKINHPFKIIMGEVMKIARNRMDGKLVNETVKTKSELSMNK